MTDKIVTVSNWISHMHGWQRHLYSATAACVLVFLSLLVYQYAASSNNWLEVRSVRVFDTVEGTSPNMLIDRTIHQTFFASWNVNVLKQDQEGFISVCTSNGRNDYQVDAHLPAKLDLNWWTYPVECKLLPGQYVVRTLWEIRAFPWFSKAVRSTSNTFKVFALNSAEAAKQQGLL